MYLDNKSRKGKIGIINLSTRSNSIRLRFTYPKGKRNDIAIASNTEDGWLQAIQIAQRINRDIELGEYEGIEKYSNKHQQSIKIAEKILNLNDYWETYKELNRLKVAKSTIKSKWDVFDKLLEETDHLEIKQATSFVQDLVKRFKPHTLKSLFSNTLHPAINLAVKQKKLPLNPYLDVAIPTPPQKDIDCYERNDIRKILEAFLWEQILPKKVTF